MRVVWFRREPHGVKGCLARRMEKEDGPREGNDWTDGCLERKL